MAPLLRTYTNKFEDIDIFHYRKIIYNYLKKTVECFSYCVLMDKIAFGLQPVENP